MSGRHVFRQLAWRAFERERYTAHIPSNEY